MRYVRTNDLPRIAKIDPDGPYGTNDLNRLFRQQGTYLIAADHELRCIDGTSETQPIGFCIYRHDRKSTTTILRVAVEDEYRRNGIGAGLLERVIDSTGARRVVCQFDSRNLPAVEFFHAMGFVIIANNRFVPDCVHYKMGWHREREEMNRANHSRFTPF